jgi:MoaA/NifB/PqqE/SkfB family radical SAM enzyme
MDTADVTRVLGKKPGSAAIEITTRCPLDCSYCKRSRLALPIGDAALEKLTELRKQLEGFKSIQFCGFGEPFSHRHIYRVLSLFRDHLVIMITCGSLPIDMKKLQESIKNGIFGFSLDAPDQEGMRLISRNYNWDNLMANLEALAKSHAYQMMINMVIDENNLTRLEEMAVFAKKMGMKAISYSLPLTDDGGEPAYVTANKARIKSCSAVAVRKTQEMGIMALSPFGELKCSMFGTIVPYIDIHGNLHTCCVTKGIGQKIGNLFDQDFETMWTSEAYQRFRNGENCKNCALYSWALDHHSSEEAQ